ncbi:MAG: hypothetical protein ACR2RD_00580 [Woeseiaceae bacterium]
MARTTSEFTEHQMSDFLSKHRLPNDFRDVAEHSYLPLVEQLPKRRSGRVPLLLGINGAQGTGKSTLADFLRLAAESRFGWSVAVLSIDDFYHTQDMRQALSKDVHPLLATRGVPGTHDVDMLDAYIERLQRAGRDDEIALPRFDKATDDRAEASRWPVVKGPIDLIILEGWCVGTRPQSAEDLEPPINALERDDDEDGHWRRYVNDQLKTRYAKVFARLDMLVFLAAPSFDAILRWRLEQERKLADKSPSGATGLMNEHQIRGFIQFYERLTRANLGTLRDTADVVFELDETHSIVS